MKNAIDHLLGQAPFSLSSRDKRPLFDAAMSEAIAFHHIHSQYFRKFAAAGGYVEGQPYETLPPIPVGVFKTVELLSVPKNASVKKVLSSATSTGIPSQVFLDHITRQRQQGVLVRILTDFFGTSRKTLLVADALKTATATRDHVSSRAAAIRGLLPIASDVVYVLGDDLAPNPDALLRAAPADSQKQPAILFGFTFLVYRFWEASRDNQAVRDGLSRFDIEHVVHIGGWKKLSDLSIDKDTFNATIGSFLDIQPQRVVDMYGMTEQLGVVYPDCPAGMKHVPVYADILIRNPQTMKVADFGEAGFIELVSPIPHSYPGIAILSDDIGVVVGEDDCSCGRKGKYFIFKERSPEAEIKGCGDTL